MHEKDYPAYAGAGSRRYSCLSQRIAYSPINAMKLLLKLLFGLLATLLGLTVLYVLVGLLLSLIPVNADAGKLQEGIPVYITTNGVHADFTMPVLTGYYNWGEYLNPMEYQGVNKSFAYIAFGWGDKGFYLNTPQWSDLTLSTAVHALFLPSPTAMHVTYYRRAPAPGENSRLLYLSQAQYQKLVEYIQASFEKGANGSPLLIPQAGYTPYDNFYEAEGSYTLLYTCNNWVNEGLKKIGVRAAVWSPFDWGIMYQLR
jgi:uncharacterized protein (TIGR02117 family)